jgi:hypothetical protein
MTKTSNESSTSNTKDDNEADGDDFAYGDEKQTSEEVVKPSESASEPTLEAKVSNLVDSMVQNSSGKWELPEDASKDVAPEILLAVKTERRFRDTQSSYTKARQELKSTQAVNKGLTEHVIKNATLHLSEEERSELDDLRATDPEAWRDKLNEHEKKAKEIQQGKIKELESEGKKASEAELRAASFEAFTQRTGIELSDEVVENQLPAAYTKNLASGKWSFDEFLTQTEQFLAPKKSIKGAKNQPKTDTKDISNLPGGAKPSQQAQTVDDLAAYKKEIF